MFIYNHPLRYSDYYSNFTRAASAIEKFQHPFVIRCFHWYIALVLESTFEIVHFIYIYFLIEEETLFIQLR